MDIDASNRSANSWGASPGRYLRGFLKCFPAVIVIGGVAAKKLLVGCRSWGNYGLLGGIGTLLFKVLNPIYWLYSGIRWCMSEDSSLSEENRKKINAFLQTHRADDKKAKLDAAWEKFKGGEFTLKEFSAIYLLQAVHRDHSGEKVRTVPLKVKLMNQVISRTLGDDELKNAALEFYRGLKKDKQLFHYLYNEDNYVKDLEKYLKTKCPGRLDSIREKMSECKRHVAAIREFEIFRGAENWEEPSEFQETVRLSAQKKGR